MRIAKSSSRPAGGDAGLVLVYMVAEIVGGWLANSLALLADAGHMLSDAAALGLSLFAAWIARRPPTPQHSYGYYRAEILAALANGATAGRDFAVVIVEAYHRLWRAGRGARPADDGRGRGRPGGQLARAVASAPRPRATTSTCTAPGCTCWPTCWAASRPSSAAR